MDLNRVTVYTTQEALELVGYTLEQAGIPQYELVEDSRVVQQFLDETAASWDYVEASSVLDARQPCVRAFLSTNQTGMQQLRALREAIAQLKQNIVGLDGRQLGHPDRRCARGGLGQQLEAVLQAHAHRQAPIDQALLGDVRKSGKPPGAEHGSGHGLRHGHP